LLGTLTLFLTTKFILSSFFQKVNSKFTFSEFFSSTWEQLAAGSALSRKTAAGSPPAAVAILNI